MSGALYGLLGEFDSSQALLDAVRDARGAGYTQLEAFSPFPIEGLAQALELPPSRVHRWGIAGALLGAGVGLAMQVSASLAYPLNIGARPVLAWPAFMVVTFLLTVLGGAAAVFLGFLFACRLPRLHHPLFDAAVMAEVSVDRFVLCIKAHDPAFDEAATQQWLAQRALSVSRVHA